ncbi:MAG: Monoacylglycerol lipase [Nocardia sp.]|uniref:alpha/beta fold hydrolase n=1 Tax=Nocardia sp. TaxID=1821 RepID=UPI0026171D1F|nr:alpha/beta hydrolase [Nocardia sp.]MCU1647660.1 Monoacylglycerol lipase [Nocardia sp.]
MSHHQFVFRASDGIGLAGYRWNPEGQAVAAVVLVHGMGEHGLRYAELAAKLTGQGYVVYGYDHRGHGATADPGARGDLGPGGWSALVADIGVFVDHVRAESRGLPIVLIAHSMGSFASQQFLLDNSWSVDAVALTGTAALDLLEPALDLERDLDLAMFNVPFEPARTDFDWLSRDDVAVDAYLADPLCGFGIDRASTKAMFAGARRLGDPAQVGKIRFDLPIYIAVGSKDPVNAELVLVEVLVQRLRDAGVEDVTLRVYPDARHELFNEVNRAEVTADLVDWLGRALARKDIEVVRRAR